MRNVLFATVASILILSATFFVSFFSDSRSISEGRIHMQKPIAIPIDSSLLKENTLLFLGYAGCEDICPPKMNEIVQIYNLYTKTSNLDDLSVLFLSLKPDENASMVQDFAKSFNSKFMGITTSKLSIQKLTRTLNAYYSKSLANVDTIDHSDALYLIKKEKDGTTYLENIYIETPYHADFIVADLMKDKQ